MPVLGAFPLSKSKDHYRPLPLIFRKRHFISTGYISDADDRAQHYSGSCEDYLVVVMGKIAKVAEKTYVFRTNDADCPGPLILF